MLAGVFLPQAGRPKHDNLHCPGRRRPSGISKGGAGIAYLTGPTGGFIIGFLIGAIVISLIKGDGKGTLKVGAACIVGGMLAVYAIGIPWLCFEITGSLFSCLMLYQRWLSYPETL